MKNKYNYYKYVHSLKIIVHNILIAENQKVGILSKAWKGLRRTFTDEALYINLQQNSSLFRFRIYTYFEEQIAVIMLS